MHRFIGNKMRFVLWHSNTSISCGCWWSSRCSAFDPATCWWHLGKHWKLTLGLGPLCLRERETWMKLLPPGCGLAKPCCHLGSDLAVGRSLALPGSPSLCLPCKRCAYSSGGNGIPISLPPCKIWSSCRNWWYHTCTGGYEKVNEAFWREPCRLPRQVQKRLERARKENCSVCVGKMVGSGVRVPVSPSGPGVASAVFWASLPTCHVQLLQLVRYFIIHTFKCLSLLMLWNKNIIYEQVNIMSHLSKISNKESLSSNVKDIFGILDTRMYILCIF